MTATTHPALDPPATDGDHYFTLAELRDEQDLPPTYPDASVTPNRDLAEQVLEHSCGLAFIPRRRTETLIANASGYVLLTQPKAREIEAIDDGTAWTPDQLARITIDDGVLTGRWTPGTHVTVTYTHGYDQPPLRVRRAAMIATRIWTTRGPVDDRATQIAADGATVNLATPGLLNAITGIPEVDATINQHYWQTNIG